MKVQPMAVNRIVLILDDGTSIDVNDGTQVEGGVLMLQPFPSNEQAHIEVELSESAIDRVVIRTFRQHSKVIKLIIDSTPTKVKNDDTKH